MKVTESTIKKIILEELQSLIESPQSQSSYEYAGYMAATRPDQFGGAYPQPGTEEYEWFMKGYDAGMADRNGIGESAGAIDESDDEVDEFAWGYDDATSGGPPQSDSQEYMDGYNDSRMTQGLDQFMAPAPGSGKPLDPSVLKNAFSSRAQRELDEDDAAGPDGSAFAGWTDDQAKRTYRSMGGDFDKVVDKADDFADDPHAYAAALQKKATGKWPTEEADDFDGAPELSEEDEAEPRHLSLVRNNSSDAESVTARLSGDLDDDMEDYESPEDLASLYADFEEEGLTPSEEAEDDSRFHDNWRERTRQGKHLSVVEQRLLRFFTE